MEVEILVAEVGANGADDQLFHILYDGTVMDERQFSVLGGDAESITGRLRELDHAELSLGAALVAGTSALSGPDRTLKAEDLEVAVLARSNGRRCFRRLADDEVAALLAG
jgi:proteasome alpha subunit